MSSSQNAKTGLGLKSFLKDKLLDLGVVAIGLLTILGFLGAASLSGIPVTIWFTRNSPEEAYILSGFAGCLVTSMLFRRRNVRQQEMLANWLGFVTEKAGLFHDPRLKIWSDEWANEDETKLELTWRTKALTFIANSVEKEEGS